MIIREDAGTEWKSVSVKMCGVSEAHKWTHFTAFTFFSSVTIFPFLSHSGLAYLGGSSAGYVRDLKLILQTQKNNFSQILSTNLSKSVLVSTSLLLR